MNSTDSDLSSTSKQWLLVFAGVSFALSTLLYGWGTTFPVLDRMKLLSYSLIPAVIVSSVLSKLILLNEGKRFREMPGFFYGFVSINTFCLVAFFAGCMLIANGFFDPSQRAVHTVRVVQKRTAGHPRNGTTRYVTVSSWRSPERTEEVEVGDGIFNLAEPGKTQIRVVTSPGRLKFEWVDQVYE